MQSLFSKPVLSKIEKTGLNRDPKSKISNNYYTQPTESEFKIKIKNQSNSQENGSDSKAAGIISSPFDTKEIVKQLVDNLFQRNPPSPSLSKQPSQQYYSLEQPYFYSNNQNYMIGTHSNDNQPQKNSNLQYKHTFNTKNGSNKSPVANKKKKSVSFSTQNITHYYPKRTHSTSMRSVPTPNGPMQVGNFSTSPPIKYFFSPQSPQWTLPSETSNMPATPIVGYSKSNPIFLNKKRKINPNNHMSRPIGKATKPLKTKKQPQVQSFSSTFPSEYEKPKPTNKVEKSKSVPPTLNSNLAIYNTESNTIKSPEDTKEIVKRLVENLFEKSNAMNKDEDKPYKKYSGFQENLILSNQFSDECTKQSYSPNCKKAILNYFPNTFNPNNKQNKAISSTNLFDVNNNLMNFENIYFSFDNKPELSLIDNMNFNIASTFSDSSSFHFRENANHSSNFPSNTENFVSRLNSKQTSFAEIIKDATIGIQVKNYNQNGTKQIQYNNKTLNINTFKSKPKELFKKKSVNLNKENFVEPTNKNNTSTTNTTSLSISQSSDDANSKKALSSNEKLILSNTSSVINSLNSPTDSSPPQMIHSQMLWSQILKKAQEAKASNSTSNEDFQLADKLSKPSLSTTGKKPNRSDINRNKFNAFKSTQRAKSSRLNDNQKNKYYSNNREKSENSDYSSIINPERNLSRSINNQKSDDSNYHSRNTSSLSNHEEDFSQDQANQFYRPNKTQASKSVNSNTELRPTYSENSSRKLYSDMFKKK